jgi:hypothetical protein
MPENLIGHLERWRASAAEAFADAKTQTDPEARQRMLDIAAGYKKLSQEAELLLGHRKGAGIFGLHSLLPRDRRQDVLRRRPPS